MSDTYHIGTLYVSQTFIIMESVNETEDMLFYLCHTQGPYLCASDVAYDGNSTFNRFKKLRKPVLVGFRQFLTVIQRISLISLLQTGE